MNNSEAALHSYFTLLKKIMEENKLMDKRAKIYNVDESGMPLDHCPPRVSTRKGKERYVIIHQVT